MPESRKAKTDSDVVMVGGDEHEPASSSVGMKMPAYVQTQEEDEIPLVCVLSQKRIASFVVKTLPSGLSKKFTSVEDVFMWDVENKEMRDLFDGTAAAASSISDEGAAEDKAATDGETNKGAVSLGLPDLDLGLETGTLNEDEEARQEKPGSGEENENDKKPSAEEALPDHAAYKIETTGPDTFRIGPVRGKPKRPSQKGPAARKTGVLTRCILRKMVEDPMSELHDEFEARLIVSNIVEADGLFLSGVPEDSGQYFQEMRAANKTKAKAVKKNPSSRKTKLEEIPLEKKSEKLQGLYERIKAKSERKK